MTTKHPCLEPGCPVLTDRRRCHMHERMTDTARGTKQQRGYDKAHDQRRKADQLLVDAGRAHCWRCGRLIPPGAPWHEGHDDHDREIHRGPECVSCNLSAAGKAAHRQGA